MTPQDLTRCPDTPPERLRELEGDAGATKADRIRASFMRLTTRVGLIEATCPKSWRHTFATLLQDANVDPLVRQITLGHAATGGMEGALGMTSIYTHTRPETQRREIFRALRHLRIFIVRLRAVFPHTADGGARRVIEFSG